MNPSVSQMNIFSLPFQCIGRLQRGHLTSTTGNRIIHSISTRENPNQSCNETAALDYSGPVDLLVLPRVASQLRNLSETAGCATFLADMVRVSATSPASDVRTLSAHLA